MNNNPHNKFYVPFMLVTSLFKDDPEFLRAQRNRGSAFITIRPESSIEEVLNQCHTHLKNLRNNFDAHMKKRASKFAVQEILRLITSPKKLQQEFKIKVKRKESRDYTFFARGLLNDYRNIIFPELDLDMKEWLTKVDNVFLEELLVSTIIPKLFSSYQEENALRVKRIVFKRLAIVMRDNMPDIKMIQKEIKDFSSSNDNHLKVFGRKIVERYKDILFLSIPNNDELTKLIQGYPTWKKNEVTWKCLKAIFNGDEI